MKTGIVYILCSLLCVLTPGCVKEEMEPSARRTVLVYLGGDNNLSGEVSQKLHAIVSGWHNRCDHLLIYQDTGAETPSLLEVVAHPAEPYTRLVKEYPGSNSADPSTFSAVIADVVAGYPSPSYGLVVFSHGTGWLPEGMFTLPRSSSVRSIMNDNGREMEIADFARVIPDDMFDFIVLEACLMSGVEVAYELRNKAGYLVASSTEILSPGFTPVYAELINLLFEPKPDLTGFVRCYYDHCCSLEGVYRSATMSLLNLKEMEALAAVSRRVLSDTDLPKINLPGLQSYDRGTNKLFFDFGDYMQQLNPAAYPALSEAVSRVVVYCASTPSFVNIPILRHSGLSVYIEQACYPELNKAYRETDWYKAVCTGTELPDFRK